jgi:hypothetical protein
MGYLPGVLEEGWGGGVQLEDVGWLTGWFTSNRGGTLSPPGVDSPCPVICGGGNIWDPP